MWIVLDTKIEKDLLAHISSNLHQCRLIVKNSHKMICVFSHKSVAFWSLSFILAKIQKLQLISGRSCQIAYREKLT